MSEHKRPSFRCGVCKVPDELEFTIAAVQKAADELDDYVGEKIGEYDVIDVMVREDPDSLSDSDRRQITDAQAMLLAEGFAAMSRSTRIRKALEEARCINCPLNKDYPKCPRLLHILPALKEAEEK
jgi:hypothetical protein